MWIFTHCSDKRVPGAGVTVTSVGLCEEHSGQGQLVVGVLAGRGGLRRQGRLLLVGHLQGQLLALHHCLHPGLGWAGQGGREGIGRMLSEGLGKGGGLVGGFTVSLVFIFQSVRVLVQCWHGVSSDSLA